MLYFFLFRTKPPPPARLNLRAPSSESPQPIELNAEREAQVVHVTDELPQPGQVIYPVDRPLIPVAPAKKTEIFFIYNAHEWESHEVLGVSPGATLQQVTERYQVLIKTSDASSFEFYEAAFRAILKRKGTL